MQKRGKWVILGLLGVIFVSIAIANTNLKYLGVLLVPFLIYYSMKKPFIFPFGLYVFLLPFDPFLSITNSAAGPKLTKLLGIATILVLSLKGAFEKKLKRPNNIVVWWVLFVSFCSLSITWAIEPMRSIGTLSTAAGLLVLYLIISTYEIKKCEYDTLKWFIVLGGFFVSLILIYKYATADFKIT
jgi:hypothetical protein